MSKHTPGPWWATDHGVRDSGGYIFHTNQVQRYEGQEERYKREVAEREANKLLAAALPELLEALKDAHPHIADDALRARIGNLIVKATGEKP